jgi:RNA polymerase sigma factor (sigma-70 family)
MDEQDLLTEKFEENRPRLRGVAYRMLGSLSEAEDAVQEAWLRLHRTEADTVDNLAGWLTTVVSRVCLDVLRTRKSRREESIGTQVEETTVAWGAGADPEGEAGLADSVGVALLVVLDPDAVVHIEAAARIDAPPRRRASRGSSGALRRGRNRSSRAGGGGRGSVGRNSSERGRAAGFPHSQCGKYPTSTIVDPQNGQMPPLTAAAPPTRCMAPSSTWVEVCLGIAGKRVSERFERLRDLVRVPKGGG